ncbi:hypothetical protein RJ639_044815 [Escallonia herrerae]|uniref:Mitochondrial arginine transporter BAC1 n=1 Tax=Escallonia herrerae TaxID=1293975 RepID=A0AA89B0U2_9ASTE|nr:hypothetical protein RJ639_044815 [Escallonia herrerae]
MHKTELDYGPLAPESVFIGLNIYTFQVKLQKHNAEANKMKYKNGMHCTARILKTEGVKGLYRGATSSFVGVAFESSLIFGIYSQAKQALQVCVLVLLFEETASSRGWMQLELSCFCFCLLVLMDISGHFFFHLKGGVQNGKPQPHVIIPSAAFGGALISFVLCPSELMKCRMQVQGTDSLVNSRAYRSPLDCAIKTIKAEGVPGIFRGGFTTLLRESIGNAVFFSTYEYVRYFMHRKLKDASSASTNLIDVGVGIMSGGLGGIAFWSAVLPLDVAKTIIQTAPDKSSTRNPFQVLKSIYGRSGLGGCYTGLGPTIVRAFPANAAAIVTWELAVKVLGIKRG